MAGEVSYEVTGTDDANGLLLVTYTQDTAQVAIGVMWDGVKPLDEALKEACPFRLLAAKLTPPNITQAVGATGLVDLPAPPPDIIPPGDAFRKVPAADELRKTPPPQG